MFIRRICGTNPPSSTPFQHTSNLFHARPPNNLPPRSAQNPLYTLAPQTFPPDRLRLPPLSVSCAQNRAPTGDSNCRGCGAGGCSGMGGVCQGSLSFFVFLNGLKFPLPFSPSSLRSNLLLHNPGARLSTLLFGRPLPSPIRKHQQPTCTRTREET